MGRHRQNAEYQYHNGGAWPFLGGFWVMALAFLGRTPEAADALSRVAGMNGVNGWAFHEWFHGRTGEPRGMAGQSWNAAAYILAERSLERPLFGGP
jgi:glycogen debranching enzyme